jgi:hypothetical protein
MLQAAANNPARRLFDIKFIPKKPTKRDARDLYDRL